MYKKPAKSKFLNKSRYKLSKKKKIEINKKEKNWKKKVLEKERKK